MGKSWVSCFFDSRCICPGVRLSTGDVMGPALGGLDQLLRLPTGCGEQNMLLFAPNIYVLDYLTNTDQLTSSVRARAIDFLHTGIVAP